jgi:sigma-B regulation protein RsbU (phosphoserine phosphatase)
MLAGDSRLNPAKFALELNRLLYEVTGEVSFATMVYCVYDAATRTLHYLSAGHSPFPIALVPGEDPRPISTASNPLLGVMPLEEMIEEAFTMPPGTLLLLATDGVIDTRSPDEEQFGYDRLLATVRAHPWSCPKELDQAVFDELTRFQAGAAQVDDIATLTIQFDDMPCGRSDK